MSIGEFCMRTVVIAYRSTTIREAAQLMREHHMGDVVVVDETDGRGVPVGLLTDRDIVIEVVAKGKEAETLRVNDVTSVPITSAREDMGVYETVQLMRRKGVRRLPVVDESGQLIGIITLDDLLELFAGEISGLVKVIKKERQKEEGVPA